VLNFSQKQVRYAYKRYTNMLIKKHVYYFVVSVLSFVLYFA